MVNLAIALLLMAVEAITSTSCVNKLDTSFGYPEKGTPIANYDYITTTLESASQRWFLKKIYLC